MIQEFSKETIEIDRQEYTLFLNRKGLVSWEKFAKVSKQAEKMRHKYEKVYEEFESDEPIDINDDTNPFEFENSEQYDEAERDEKELIEIYVKFYWIALYENHKLPISQVSALFEKASDEYGIEQLIALANQMIEDMNINKYGEKQIKKLTALKSTK